MVKKKKKNKNPELPDGLQGSVFMGKVRDREAGWVISLCTII